MDNRLLINRYLGANGLATLDDPGGLIQQLAFLIEDHDHFRQVINKCESRYRRDMYEALRPHLSFEAKPLDVYIAELGHEAEREQLPTVDRDGKLHAYRVSQIASDSCARAASEAIEAMAKYHLALTCRKCTRQQIFHGGTKADAIYKARAEGWTYGLDKTGDGYEICPECPAGRTATAAN